MRRGALIATLTAALALAPVTSATAAGVFQQIFNDFKADQRISGCAWTVAQLREAKSQIPPDIEQYAPNLVDELNRALHDHALGTCDPKPKPTEPAVTPAPPPPPPPAADRAPLRVDPGPAASPPAPPTADPVLASTPVPDLDADREAPLVLLILAGLLAAALLGSGLGALAWWQGWDLSAPWRRLAVAGGALGGRLKLRR